jgi:S1-C subfamily serine protease
VLVIGNPEGLTGTVSDGIISAFRKNGAMIQFTAPVSPGSSGSPVLDPESGNVIGIAHAIRKERQNLNFAISVDAAKVAITKDSDS